ncbi:extracellular solute-binding protein [Paenibacillus prosopidis]|uniref:Putative aldouronate transport system substrate-binding protein n=1 Tax=Paenibacillus prosopidis TaxID=630520 RepID=A0A368W421_9BACL|nr:extracellular solute-binding protein [Paenibacillus prosopidis]RCW47477.1 putative aldouronate transport system substrate-binding protein [Paenibacillus prosopidis]
MVRSRTIVLSVTITAAIALISLMLWVIYERGLPAGGSLNRGAETVIRKPGEFPIADTRVKLEVLVGSDLTKEELDNNWFTKYVEQKLGIDLQFVIAKESELDKVEDVLFASGDYPPIILDGSLTPDEQVRYGQRGIFRPLNGLIDQYGDRLKEIFRQNPGLKKSITAPDGNIYALPSVNECLHCWYAQKLWINTSWLNKLNLQMPRTTEELYHVLRAFKLKDPNGNGLQDEIPLSGAVNSWHTEITGFLMSAFIYNTDTNYFYVHDGTVGIAAIQPEWREGLAYIRKLFREGLIDPEVFTQSIDGLVETASRKDNVLGAVTSGYARMVFNSSAGYRSGNYEAVPPLIGPSGYQAAGFFSSFDRAVFAVTDKATAAEAAAALRLADFLMTEEATIRNEWGPENKWWRKGRPGEYDEHGRPAKYRLDPEFSSSSAANDVWAQMGLLYRDRDLRESWAVSADPNSFVDYEHRLYVETLRKYAGKEPDEVYPDYIFMDTTASEEAARLMAPIDEYIRTNLVQFITGVKDTDADWDDYVDGLKQLKLDRYMEIHQNAYNAFKRKQ